MYDAVNTLAGAIPAQAATLLNDLRPLLVLGIGLGFAASVAAFVKGLM